MLPAYQKLSLLLLTTALVCLSLTLSACGPLTGCDDRGSYAVSLEVVNQSGDPLAVQEVSWTASNGNQGEAECWGGDTAPCDHWMIGPDDRGEHDATFDITIKCGTETKTKTVEADGDYCHWDTRDITVAFDDRESC